MKEHKAVNIPDQRPGVVYLTEDPPTIADTINAWLKGDFQELSNEGWELQQVIIEKYAVTALLVRTV